MLGHLIQNAIEATPKDGMVTVALRRVHTDGRAPEAVTDGAISVKMLGGGISSPAMTA